MQTLQAVWNIQIWKIDPENFVKSFLYF